MKDGRSPLRQRWVWALMLLLVLLITTACADITTTQDIPNPRSNDTWVVDLEEDLSDFRKEKLNQALATLHDQTGVEIFVLTVGGIYSLPEYGLATVDQLAEQVFDEWNVGQESGQGLVLVVSDVGYRVAVKMTESLASRLPPADLEPYLFITIIPDLTTSSGVEKLYSINRAMEALISALTGGPVLADRLGKNPEISQRLILPVVLETEHPTPTRVSVMVAKE